MTCYKRSMPVVPEAERLGVLSQYGVSAELIHIAEGKLIPAALAFRCQPVYLPYAKAGSPGGFLSVPLWEVGTEITAVCSDSTGLMFFTYSAEAPEYIYPIGHSEQGLWAHLFVNLIEDEVQDLETLAEEIKFRYFALLVQRYDTTLHSTWEQHAAFLNALITEIDALAYASTD
jgi:hypothetical protein